MPVKTPEINKALECLDKMQFFMGQRAGRELWMDKPHDVQERDIEQYNRDIETVRTCIQQLEVQVATQTVDAEPVRRGRWIETKIGFHCSNCKKKPGQHPTSRGAYLSDYCPRCGAKMGGAKDGN